MYLAGNESVVATTALSSMKTTAFNTTTSDNGTKSHYKDSPVSVLLTKCNLRICTLCEYLCFNSFSLLVAQWTHMTTYTWVYMVPIMACCLTTPSHYLHQSRLIIALFILWNSTESYFNRSLMNLNPLHVYNDYTFEIISTSPRGKWINLFCFWWVRITFMWLICPYFSGCFIGSIVTVIEMTHYNDVIMGTMAPQITSLTIVYSTVYSGADQRKHQSSASLAFVRGIHRWPVNSPHKNGQWRGKYFHLMTSLRVWLSQCQPNKDKPTLKQNKT